MQTLKRYLMPEGTTLPAGVTLPHDAVFSPAGTATALVAISIAQVATPPVVTSSLPLPARTTVQAADVQQLLRAFYLGAAATALTDPVTCSTALANQLGQQGHWLNLAQPVTGLHYTLLAPAQPYTDAALATAVAMPSRACFCLVDRAWLSNMSPSTRHWLSMLHAQQRLAIVPTRTQHYSSATAWIAVSSSSKQLQSISTGAVASIAACYL